MRLSMSYSIIANRYHFSLNPRMPIEVFFFLNWETLFYFFISSSRARRSIANPRDIETSSRSIPVTRYPLLLSLSIRTRDSPLLPPSASSDCPVFLERVLASVPFPPLLLRPLFLFLPPPVENPYTLLAGPSGRARRGARRVVCSLFRKNRRFLVSPPAHRFLRRTFADVLPLSSRKFFYNFRIVLFRSSPFFYLCAVSRTVGFFFHYQPSLPSVFFIRLCFRFFIFTSFYLFNLLTLSRALLDLSYFRHTDGTFVSFFGKFY